MPGDGWTAKLADAGGMDGLWRAEEPRQHVARTRGAALQTLNKYWHHTCLANTVIRTYTNKRPLLQKTFDNGGIVRSVTSRGVSETFIDRWYGRVLMRTNVYREGVMVCGPCCPPPGIPWSSPRLGMPRTEPQEKHSNMLTCFGGRRDATS